MSLSAYAVVPLGLEPLALAELHEISQTEVQGRIQCTLSGPGGIDLSCESLFDLLLLQSFTKLASRVLLRVSRKKVEDIGQLKEVLLQKSWREWTGPQKLTLQIDSVRSKLHNEKWIRKHMLEFAVDDLTEDHEDEMVPKIFFRWQDDWLTVSLDLTGEHLHRRGYRTLVGEAPLRETIAAVVLHKLFASTSQAEFEQITLIDPFCGSGTLLLEAPWLYSSGPRIDFSFLRWTGASGFKAIESWKKLKKPCASLRFASLRGSDLELANVELAKKNLNQLHALSEQVDPQISFEQKDFFDFTRPLGKRVWMVSNLPYNERIKLKFSWSRFAEKWAQVQPIERAGFLVHRAQSEECVAELTKALPAKSHKLETFAFKNNGVPVSLILLLRNQAMD